MSKRNARINGLNATFYTAMLRAVKNAAETQSDCWEWPLKCNRGGYGQLLIEGKLRQTHRLSYEQHVGPIPAGFHVLHACDNPACMNPNHLWTGTAADNMRDKSAKGRHHNQQKIACKRGHVFTPDNTYVSPSGTRTCITCRRVSVQRQSDRKKIEAAWAANPAGEQTPLF